jgi:GNAT superfamily N-acetyltransferase
VTTPLEPGTILATHLAPEKDVWRSLIESLEPTDLPQIVAIYNATVASRMVTADLDPVPVESRLAWFEQHDPRVRPLWVVDGEEQIAGWLSLSDFYGRPAYHRTAEVSVYVRDGQRRKGVGAYLLSQAIRQCAGARHRHLDRFDLRPHTSRASRSLRATDLPAGASCLASPCWMGSSATSLLSACALAKADGEAHFSSITITITFSMAEYKLYCMGESGNSYKAALMLALTGVKWQSVWVDYFPWRNAQDKFRDGVSEMESARARAQWCAHLAVGCHSGLSRRAHRPVRRPQ